MSPPLLLTADPLGLKAADGHDIAYNAMTTHTPLGPAAGSADDVPWRLRDRYERRAYKAAL
jgi:hypothetical protein